MENCLLYITSLMLYNSIWEALGQCFITRGLCSENSKSSVHFASHSILSSYLVRFSPADSNKRWLQSCSLQRIKEYSKRSFYYSCLHWGLFILYFVIYFWTALLPPAYKSASLCLKCDDKKRNFSQVLNTTAFTYWTPPQDQIICREIIP